MLNLFIGIIVDAMQTMHEEEGKPDQVFVTRQDIARVEAKLDELLKREQQ